MRKQKSPQDTTSPEIVVSKHFRKSLVPRIGGGGRKPLLLVAVIVVLVGAVGYIYNRHLQNKTVLAIGQYKYGQRQYDQLIADAAKLKINSYNARQAIIAGLAARAAADELRIGYPTDEATFNQSAASEFGVKSGGKISEFQRISTAPLVVKQYVDITRDGGYQAAIIEFPFCRYIVGSPTNGGTPNLVGNIKAIQSDIAYAKTAYQKFQRMLDNGQITPKEAVDQVKADDRLTYAQYTNPSQVELVSDNRAQADETSAIIEKDQVSEAVKAAAAQPNKVRVSEVTFTYPPSSYGVNMPELQRGSGMQVGWRLVLVTHKYEKRADIMTRFNQLVKEFSNV